MKKDKRWTYKNHVCQIEYAYQPDVVKAYYYVTTPDGKEFSAGISPYVDDEEVVELWIEAGYPEGGSYRKGHLIELINEQAGETNPQAHMQSKQDVIKQAISKESIVWIKYRDSHGNVTEREVAPLQWTASNKFRAFCHLRQAEREFRIDRIIQLEPNESLKEAITSLHLQAHKGSSNDAETLYRPTPRKITRKQARKQIGKDTEKVSKQRLTKVETGAQWSRLVKYYTKCLTLENLQQYVINNKPDVRLFFHSSSKEVHDFLTGQVALYFHQKINFGHLTSAGRFVNRGQDQQGKQLCLGYPILVVNKEKLAPLIISSVKVERSGDLFSIRADEPTPSYAALSAFGLKDEEIEALLTECASVQPQQGQSIVEAWEGFLVGYLSEFLGISFDKRAWDGRGPVPDEPGILLSVPCLFWVEDNIATMNLIKDLRQLSDSEKWTLAPVALKRLLDKVPEQDYPGVPSLAEDNNVYVTEMNREQRRAIAAMQSKDVTVVTGPPGTGKSQMVLNIVAHAVMNDQSVLFASRNNKAVDVVMDRLKKELGFSGAIRTGNREYRELAAKNMAAALSEISSTGTPTPAASLREEYLQLKHQLQGTEGKLYQVRESEGLLESHCTERDDLVELLPKPVVKAGESYAPPFSQEETKHLQATISTFITLALKTKDATIKLEKELSSIVADNELQSSFIAALESFEEQWGAFGGRFLHPGRFDALEDLRAYAQVWLELLPALDARSRVTQLAGQYREANSTYMQHQESLPSQLIEQIRPIALETETKKLLSLTKEARKMSARAQAIADGKLSLWDRLLTFLGLMRPVDETTEQLIGIRDTLRLDWKPLSSQENFDVADLNIACYQLATFTEACWLRGQMHDFHQALECEQQKLDEALEALAPSLADDVRRVDLPDTDSSTLRKRLGSILAHIDELIARRDRLAERINAKLDENEDALEMLENFKATPAGKDKLLWTLRLPIHLSIIISHLTKWRNLVSLWEIDEAIRVLRERLETLPSEGELVSMTTQLKEKQMMISAKLMKSRWLEHARDLDTYTLQKAHRYASALEQLLGPYDPSTYSSLKASVESNLPAALEVFPIWATTNLSAKTNFPLKPGLFDIIVIDEASQCDMPSALPLLYRAKRAVIIGDPNQLRHVATLYEESDVEAADKFGIAPDAFLYNTHSLFDIAERSIGAHPGALFLKEHYRSDAQIIEFSNEEFYNKQLVIRTDLSLRGMPKSFLERGCGAFWLHTDGKATHPPGGSAYNLNELKTLQEIIPSIVDAVRRYEKPNRQIDYAFSIGIVTPYREQADRIKNLISRTYRSDRIAVGTAHTFQGNERDIMIFSPVLAPGLSEGSLNWLNRTDNLLNVAITRARAQLIVLGHWDYCHRLPPSSKYRRLADYIGEQLGHRVLKIDELPILDGEHVDVIGALTGDKHSRTTLRRFITSCKEFVWWVDPYLQDHVFDLFWDVFQHSDVDINDVRLLTSAQQTKGTQSGRPRLKAERAQALQSELHSRGVSFELRLLPKKELPHDRFLYSVGESINMPPFGGAYGDHKHVSEYTHSETDIAFFEQYWDQATPA